MSGRIYMHHVRTAKLCSGGARRWFDAHGFSWDDFLTNGISIDTVEALDDAIANRVIKIARAEDSDGRRR